MSDPSGTNTTPSSLARNCYLEHVKGKVVDISLVIQHHLMNFNYPGALCPATGACLLKNRVNSLKLLCAMMHALTNYSLSQWGI